MHGFTVPPTAAGSGQDAASTVFPADQPTSIWAPLLAEVPRANDKTVRVEMPLTTLAALLPTRKLQHVHFLTVDTEGAELDVPTGTPATVAASAEHWAQFEFNTMNIAARTYFDDFTRVLPECRFFRLLQHGLMALDGFIWPLPNFFVDQNLLAARSGPSPPIPFRL